MLNSLKMCKTECQIYYYNRTTHITCMTDMHEYRTTYGLQDSDLGQAHTECHCGKIKHSF